MIIRLNTQVNLETIYIFQLSFLFDDFDDHFSYIYKLLYATFPANDKKLEQILCYEFTLNCYGKWGARFWKDVN